LVTVGSDERLALLGGDSPLRNPKTKLRRPKPDQWLWVWRIVCLGIFFVSLILAFGSRLIGGEGMITVSGTRIATLASASAARGVVRDFEEGLRKQFGDRVTFEGDIEVRKGKRPASEVVSEKEAADLLSKALHPRVELSVVYVDGERLFGLDSVGEAKAALRLYAERFTKGAKLTAPPKFKESAEIKTEKCPPELRVESAKAAADLLAKGTSEAQAVYHVVKSGQTASKIAHLHALTLGQLKALNPGVNLDRLHIGDKLVVKKGAKKGRLTVVTTSRETLTVPMDFPVQVVKSNELYLGKTLIKQPGVFGTKRVEAFVTYHNGERASRAEVRSAVVREPVAEIVIEGTLMRPSGGEAASPIRLASSGGWGERMARTIYLQYRKGNEKGRFRGVYGTKELDLDIGTAHSLNHAFGVHYTMGVPWATIVQCLERGDHSIGGRWGCAGGPHNPKATATWIKKKILKR
jgi:LysM repeat protein